MKKSAKESLLALTRSHEPLLSRSLLLLVILAGFAIRIYALEGQSMWSDEGLSLYRARLSIQNIFQGFIIVDGIETIDTNPPLYFLLLHLWRAGVGETVFALRTIGVAIATIAIPLIYGIGSITFGRRVGLLAGLLLAISPFHVWQSQVLRNYGVLITLNLLSIYALFNYVLARRDRRKNKWLILWAIVALIGIYTHYFGFFIFAFGVATLLLDAIMQWRLERLLRARPFWIGLGVTLLIFLPAVYIAWDRFRIGKQVDYFYVPVATVAYRALSAFAVGMERSLVHPWWLLIPAVVLAIAGLFFGWQARRRATLLLVGYQLIPLGLLLALSAINPLYNGTRHLLIGLPPFILLMAVGVNGPFHYEKFANRIRLRRVVSGIAVLLGILVVIIQINWLQEQFTSPRLIRDDVRGAAEYLNTNAAADDLIVIHDTLIRFTFDYYYDGDAALKTIPDFNQHDVQQAINTLKSLGNPGQRIWFLTEPTPRTGFERQALIDWADANWGKISERSFPHMWLPVGLNTYIAEPAVVTVPQAAEPLAVVWEDVLRLHGYESAETVEAGQELWLTLYLSQLTETPEQYTVSIRLVDDYGQEWAQIDDVIDEGFPPTTDETNIVTRYDHVVDIPAGLPRGSYQMWMRLVETKSGQAKSVAPGEIDTRLADITIQPTTCSGNSDQLEADNYPNVSFGGQLELVAFNRLESAEIRPGHQLPLSFWWCTEKSQTGDHRLRLQLVDEQNVIVEESIHFPSRPDHLPADWVPGELVMGLTGIDIPASVDAGEYEIRLSILDADSETALSAGSRLAGKDHLTLGSVDVLPFPMESEPPPVANLVRAEFGDPHLISLHGYDLKPKQVTAGENIDLTLVWQALADEVPVSYSLFLHVAADDEEIISQEDGIPVTSSRPTTSWRRDEIIVDPRGLKIPADVEPGEYNLWIGFYDPATSLRLPVLLNGEQQMDSRLLLQKITVTE